MKRNVIFILMFVLFLTIGAVRGKEVYWVPKDLPKSHYQVDARIDFKNKCISGKEIISLKNTGPKPLTIIGVESFSEKNSSPRIFLQGNELSRIDLPEFSTDSNLQFYRFSNPVLPGANIDLEFDFKTVVGFSPEDDDFISSILFPRLYWDGLPVHDSYSVKLEVPEGFAIAASGRLNPDSGRYEIAGAKTFGLYLGKNLRTESREAEGVLITVLFTEKGAMAARVCLDAAVDAIKFYKNWLGFYPFNFLYIVPGGPGRWGGYPVATGMVAIHGLETFKEGEPITHWQQITAHEIGHEYWGEWVLDPDKPAWLWIGMGIFADTEYILSRKINLSRRHDWMSDYKQGISNYYDTTVDITEDLLDIYKYDRNNIVTHSKGFSIISALDCVLGRETFLNIYKKCLIMFGGKRLGWREFQDFCEQEAGQSLDWFFSQWIRTNYYLSYQAESKDCRKKVAGFESMVKIKKLGTMSMPVPVKVVFKDGSQQIQYTHRILDTNVLDFISKSELQEVIIDPEGKLAMVKDPLPEISEDILQTLSLGWDAEESSRIFQKIQEEDIKSTEIWHRLGLDLYENEDYPSAFLCFSKILSFNQDKDIRFEVLGWLGLLSDLMKKRNKALEYYKEALSLNTDTPFGYSWLKININKQWVKERLESPFTIGTKLNIPVTATSEEWIKIVNDLNWKNEGQNPLIIFHRVIPLNITSENFWFKLAMLLFDSSFYQEAQVAYKKVIEIEPTKIRKFAAYTWLGHIMDLLGEREKAVDFYQKALEFNPGQTMIHSQYRMRINRQWLEKRLKVPFTWERK